MIRQWIIDKTPSTAFTEPRIEPQNASKVEWGRMCSPDRPFDSVCVRGGSKHFLPGKTSYIMYKYMYVSCSFVDFFNIRHYPDISFCCCYTTKKCGLCGLLYVFNDVRKKFHVGMLMRTMPRNGWCVVTADILHPLFSLSIYPSLPLSPSPSFYRPLLYPCIYPSLPPSQKKK